jgi:hypothetical protein
MPVLPLASAGSRRQGRMGGDQAVSLESPPQGQGLGTVEEDIYLHYNIKMTPQSSGIKKKEHYKEIVLK